MTILRPEFGSSLNPPDQPGQNKSKDWDYSRLPKTGRELTSAPGQSWEQQRNQMENSAESFCYLKIAVECTAKKHWPGNAIFACTHCNPQDPVNPVGIWLMPRGYYLCKWCFEKYGHRDSTLWYQVATTCWDCIIEEITRIRDIDPKNFVDLKTKK